MLKRDITYEDFNGNTVTETFYFNISKPELIEMEAEHPEGFVGWMQKIIDAKDNKTLMQQFKQIVLMAYGEKSEDGKRFVKNEEIKEQFAQTAAYIALFTELAMDDNAASTFVLGIMPKDLAASASQAPVAPTPPTS